MFHGRNSRLVHGKMISYHSRLETRESLPIFKKMILTFVALRDDDAREEEEEKEGE